jgi:hypothetical protein
MGELIYDEKNVSRVHSLINIVVCWIRPY